MELGSGWQQSMFLLTASAVNSSPHGVATVQRAAVHGRSAYGRSALMLVYEAGTHAPIVQHLCHHVWQYMLANCSARPVERMQRVRGGAQGTYPIRRSHRSRKLLLQPAPMALMHMLFTPLVGCTRQ